MTIKFGTNRIAIIGKRFVYKLPIGICGLLANRMEFRLAKNQPLVAKTQKCWWGLKQERLWNVVTYPYQCDCVLPEHQEVYKTQLHNRLQIGQDASGAWKIFDYEDVKYKPSSGSIGQTAIERMVIYFGACFNDNRLGE